MAVAMSWLTAVKASLYGLRFLSCLKSNPMECTVERLSDLPLPDHSATRSKGIHVSSIIRCVATETGILKPEWCEELSLVDVRDMSHLAMPIKLRIHLGLAWEEYYLPMIEGVDKHPGEYCVDGVYMTPDGESLSVIITVPTPKKGIKVHEVKCTSKSVTTTGEDLSGPANFMWLCQLKAYCKGANTLFADLHALHLMGNYKWPYEMQINIYHCKFTQEEIDDNWQLLTEYKEMRLLEEAL